MLATVGSKHRTGRPDLMLQLSCLSSYFARNICCLCINISLAPAAALWQNESQQGWLSAVLVFPESAGFSVCPPERLEFSSPLFKLRLRLWRGFRGRSGLKCVTGAWAAKFQMLPFHFVSYWQGKWKWKSCGSQSKVRRWDNVILILIQTTAKKIVKGENEGYSVSCYCLCAGVLYCNLLMNFQICKSYFQQSIFGKGKKTGELWDALNILWDTWIQEMCAGYDALSGMISPPPHYTSNPAPWYLRYRWNLKWRLKILCIGVGLIIFNDHWLFFLFA